MFLKTNRILGFDAALLVGSGSVALHFSSISGTFPSTVPSLSFPGFLFYFFVTSQTLP